MKNSSKATLNGVLAEMQPGSNLLLYFSPAVTLIQTKSTGPHKP